MTVRFLKAAGSARRALIAGAALGSILLASGAAHATDFVLDLTGDVENLQLLGGPNLSAVLDLTNPDGSAIAPFTLTQGDTLTTNVTIAHGPFVVPSAVQEFLFLNLTGPDDSGPVSFTDGDVNNSGTFSLDGGPTVDTNCGNCLSETLFTSHQTLSFSSLTSISQITGLPVAFTVTDIDLFYQITSPDSTLGAPEPASWALMLIGFGGLGAQLRNRRRTWAAP